MSNYSTFDEIEDPILQTWNRTATYFNIIYDKGKDEANKYIDQFPTVVLEQVQAMITLIQKEGLEAVRKAMLNGELEFKKSEVTLH